MKKYILLLFSCLYTLSLQAQGIKINTIQLTGIQWLSPVTGTDTLLKTSDIPLKFSCRAECNAPLTKENFTIWIDNQKIASNNDAIVQNNVLEIPIHLNPKENHYVKISVLKGKSIFFTSTLHIVAQRRYALLIANSAYQTASQLDNVPIQDISILQKSLINLGFKVDTAINQSREQMLKVLDIFVEETKKADIVFYYYSGHGIQASKQNYLVPIDASFKSVADIPNRGISVQAMVDKLDEAQAAFKIVVLDACRNNSVPIAISNARGDNTRGFATIKDISTTTGSFIVNSTQADMVASNDGVFAKELSKYLVKGKTATSVFRTVRQKTKEASQGRQEPDIKEDLGGDNDFIF